MDVLHILVVKELKFLTFLLAVADAQVSNNADVDSFGAMPFANVSPIHLHSVPQIFTFGRMMFAIVSAELNQTVSAILNS